MAKQKYIIETTERDWTIFLSSIHTGKEFDPLSIGRESEVPEFAHVREDENRNILLIHDVIWVSSTSILDKRFSEVAAFEHKGKLFEGTLNDALEYIKKEMQDG